MKKSFLFILSIVAMICLLSNQSALRANVYSQFDRVGTKGFQWIDSLSTTGYTRIPEAEFKINWQSASPTADTELDDGYAKIPLGFTYRYNDSNYHEVYVSINGFITFELPPNITELSRRDTNLFRSANGVPSNVIAPYWGDHKYWKSNDPQIGAHGCAPSEIGYERGTIITINPLDTPNTWIQNYCLIRWSNLNVNYRTHPEWEGSSVAPEYFYGNIASFQMIIYEGPPSAVISRGDVEFQYNTLGRTLEQTNNFPNSILNPANRAAIGVNGTGLTGTDADFINALYNGNRFGYPASVIQQRTEKTFATEWPPSWNATHSIILIANYRIDATGGTGDTIWGDGDADMSKIAGGRHNIFADKQQFFVTMSDVRRIMVALIDGKPLDSAYKQAAFHGDVNHNGRYYYLNANDVIVRRFGNPSNPSKDTFSVSLTSSGVSNAFLPYYGKNNDYIEMDFMGLEIVSEANRYRRVKLIDPFPNNGNEVRVTLLNLADTTVMLNAVTATSGAQGTFPEDKVSLKIKKNINWTDSLYRQGLEGLPIGGNLENQIFWEADEDDAADIISYLGGRHPYLPWWYGNTEWQRPGKISVPYQYANNIIFKNAEMLDNGTIKIPVYVNGQSEGTLSSFFTLNTDIVNVESAHPDLVVEYSNDTKKAVFAASGYFTVNTPVAYLFVKNNEQNEIKATSVRFNGNSVSDVSLKLNGQVFETETNSAIQIKTNPVATNTDIVLNIANTGNYSLAIYDVNGNIVKTLSNGLLSAGNHQFTFNVDVEAEGTYFCRLEGENISLTKKIIIVR
jgi:hypothetical protein